MKPPLHPRRLFDQMTNRSFTHTNTTDRRRHLRRLREGEAGPPDPAVLGRIQALGLGRKQTGKDTPRYRQGSKDPATATATAGSDSGGIGAAGFSTYLAASSGGQGEGWPAFKHMLPEVAMAGHSNCGKSSLVNALAGLAPQKGPARVSDRAGWTDAVFFYQLGKRPPVVTLADLPGYGHAVASVQQRRRWRTMVHDFLKERAVLSLCCVLVDCVRGLCREDKDLLRLLKVKKNRAGMGIIYEHPIHLIPWMNPYINTRQRPCPPRWC